MTTTIDSVTVADQAQPAHHRGAAVTPEEIREHAAAIMIDHARDVERMSIREHLQEEGIDLPDALDVSDIYDLIAKATVVVEFPEEQP